MAIQINRPDSPEVSVFPTDVEAPTSPRPLLYVEICRGKTKHPKRPVRSRNFLIGSGSDCDLRLGGAEIPAAYAALIAHRGEVRVQWFSEGPELQLNGVGVHEAVLQNGDVIGFGRFAFRVSDLECQPAEEAPKTPMEAEALGRLLSTAKAAESEADLSELTATELAERLEAEAEQLEEFQAAIRRGEEALLFAAAQRGAALSEEASQQQDDATETEEHLEAAVLEELERVIRQLNGFSSELDERATRLADQEATQNEAADLLLRAQSELAAQLERFHQHITENQSQDQNPPGPTLRKAA